MLKRVKYIETYTDAINQRFEVYGKAIKERFHEKYTEESFTGPSSTKPTMDMWAKIAKDDKDI